MSNTTPKKRSANLSKSRYTLSCQCLKALWLRVYKPEEAVVDPATEARFEMGNVVGDLAMGLFGDFVEVTTKREDGSLDIAAMIEKTKDCLANGTENICEASFAIEGHYCAVDILRKTPGGYAIYEVKSSSFPEFNGQETKLEKYAPDIAYQKWLLEQCGVNVTGTYLVCLNSDYVRQGELDLQHLFVTIDMKELVANEYVKVPNQTTAALKTLQQEEEPALDLSKDCHKPYPCAFWQYCTRHLESPSVFDLYRMNFSDKLKLYQQGYRTLGDVASIVTKPIHLLQVNQQANIDKQGISAFLDQLIYPLYFLDFETMQQAIPQYDGARPYQQITFQYSLHILREEGGELEHREFLAPSDGSDPRRALAEQLCKDIPMDVCTLAYNKAFECTRIKELAVLYPDLAAHLLNIRDHIADLLDPFQAGYYYLPSMGNSFSIKRVLPSLFPDDPQLDYHNLDTRVQNGGDAMTVFPRIQNMDPEEAAATREALLRYCELDTLAMVKVWEKLKEVTKL